MLCCWYIHKLLGAERKRERAGRWVKDRQATRVIFIINYDNDNIENGYESVVPPVVIAAAAAVMAVVLGCSGGSVLVRR